MAALQKLIEYRNKYVNRSDDKISRDYLVLIDGAIAELSANATIISTQKEREKRLQKYGFLEVIWLDRVLAWENDVYEMFDRIVTSNELYREDIPELVYSVCQWESISNAELGLFQLYSQYQKLRLISNERNDNSDALLADMQEFEKKHRWRIDVYWSDEELAEKTRAFMCHLRGLYFPYIEKKYKRQ